MGRGVVNVGLGVVYVGLGVVVVKVTGRRVVVVGYVKGLLGVSFGYPIILGVVRVVKVGLCVVVVVVSLVV